MRPRCACSLLSRDWTLARRSLAEEEASAREWRECGATSADAACAAYTAVLRRRWGCTVALAGARLRLSRAYLAGGADHEATDAGDAATGFDFGDAARMAAELAPMLGGAPAGQRDR